MCYFQTFFGCLNIFPQLLDYSFYGPLFLRIGLAAVFIVRGYPKLFGGISGTAQFFESIGIKPGKFCAIVVGVVEFCGGILLLIGLFVQPVALLLAINMVVAIWKVKYQQGFSPPAGGGWEFDLVLLLMALALLVLGAGAHSLDLPF